MACSLVVRNPAGLLAAPIQVTVRVEGATDLHPGDIPAHRSGNQTSGKFGAHAAFTSSAAIRLSSSRDLPLFSGNPMSLMHAAVHRASYFARASCSGVIFLGRISPLLGSPVCGVSLHRRWCHRSGSLRRVTSPRKSRALTMAPLQVTPI